MPKNLGVDTFPDPVRRLPHFSIQQKLTILEDNKAEHFRPVMLSIEQEAILKL